jgi:hypothetical protein
VGTLALRIAPYALFQKDKREAWYREQLRRCIDAWICHPKIVETGLDLLDFPTILFHETGYSLHATPGQPSLVEDRPATATGSQILRLMQEMCLRLLGKKLLVALAMEGSLPQRACRRFDGDDDILTAMARELVQNKASGESAIRCGEVWGLCARKVPGHQEKNQPNGRDCELQQIARDTYNYFESVLAEAVVRIRVRADGLMARNSHCSDNTMCVAEVCGWQTHFGLRVALWAAVLRA